MHAKKVHYTDFSGLVAKLILEDMGKARQPVEKNPKIKREPEIISSLKKMSSRAARVL